VTYVEMTDPSQLNPGTVAPGLALTIADKRLPLVSDILARIGAPYGWRSSYRTPEEWPAWFAEHPGRTSWLLHTSSADNPNALPNYHRRGFRTFKTEEYV